MLMSQTGLHLDRRQIPDNRDDEGDPGLRSKPYTAVIFTLNQDTKAIRASHALAQPAFLP